MPGVNLGTPRYHPPQDRPADHDPGALWSLTCDADECTAELFGETPMAAEANMAVHLRAHHPAVAALLDVAANIAGECYARLEELSGDTGAPLSGG